MTQKYAVVPYREVPANRQYPEVRTGDHWTSLSKGSGKLTREQVEAMALVAANKFYGFNYTAVDEKFLKSFVAGLVSGGLSVED
ncbi:hypothetical protein [Thalassospira alkalitolerans]|uniref:hypothetical protein n=1 Tax=Thalassospira alkalitolerans TaxID=1293890 RepID=UPI003AA8BCB3